MILSLMNDPPRFSVRSITDRGRLFPEIGAGLFCSILLTKHAISCILRTVFRIWVKLIVLNIAVFVYELTLGEMGGGRGFRYP